jgi:hypothetical protein
LLILLYEKKQCQYSFRYILLIAIIVIIYLSTVKFGANDELVKYLGFGLTITSLFVGLVAITQAFFAGNSLDKTIVVLDKSTQDMVETASDVKSIIQTLQVKVDQIPKQLNELNDKITSNLIKTEIEKVEGANSSKAIKVTKEQILEFLNNSSTNGVLAIYAAAKANDSKKTFNPNELFLGADNVLPPYMFGYIVAARSFKVFKASFNGGEVGIFDSEIASNDIIPIMKKKIDGLKIPTIKEQFFAMVKKIDEHFDA